MQTVQTQLLVSVSSYFVSIQGEGPEAGRPAFFLRLAGCSVGCIWCDTPYTWKKDQLQSKNIPIDDLLKVVQDIVLQYPHGNLICVITGGEPIDKPYLPRLTKELRRFFQFIALETSGYKPFLYDLFDSISLSIKLSSSQVPEKKRINPAVINAGIQLPHCFFKFVVNDDNDWKEMLDLKYRFSIPSRKIWIMPCCVTREEYIAKSQWLIPKCIQEGLRFCSREQIAIWSNEKDR
jgi:7-carboxy-7-deazaguanine synthase